MPLIIILIEFFRGITGVYRLLGRDYASLQDVVSVRRSVCPVLFSNDEKRHLPCSDDDEIRYGLR